MDFIGVREVSSVLQDVSSERTLIYVELDDGTLCGVCDVTVVEDEDDGGTPFQYVVFELSKHMRKKS